MCDTCGCNITPGNQHLVKPEGKLGKTPEGRASIEVLSGLAEDELVVEPPPREIS